MTRCEVPRGRSWQKVVSSCNPRSCSAQRCLVPAQGSGRRADGGGGDRGQGAVCGGEVGGVLGVQPQACVCECTCMCVCMGMWVFPPMEGSQLCS